MILSYRKFHKIMAFIYMYNKEIIYRQILEKELIFVYIIYIYIIYLFI